MAEHDTAQERTESATPKRREEARRKGEVPRSRDLNSAAVTLFSCGALLLFGEQMAGAFIDLMRSSLSPRFAAPLSGDAMLPALGAALWAGFMAVSPVLAAGFLAALLAPMTLSGWNFSSEALTPKFSRLDPIAGVGRMLSINGLIELGKSLLAFALIAVSAYLVLRRDAGKLLGLGQYTTAAGVRLAAQLCAQALLLLACGMLVIAAIDVPIQLWQHSKQLKMSREEIKQEMKESDGSPEMKGKIRRLQQDLARGRMMAEVPRADVVVTNPTHFAVALRYDETRSRAPIVVAKGVDEVAARIRELATEHNVAIFEAPPLARVLYRSVELNREIPASLYMAVAQVLTYIFQLRAYKRGELAAQPIRPTVEVKE